MVLKGSPTVIVKILICFRNETETMIFGWLGIEMLFYNDLSYLMMHVVVTIHDIVFG